MDVSVSGVFCITTASRLMGVLLAAAVALFLVARAWRWSWTLLMVPIIAREGLEEEGLEGIRVSRH
jgi:hypothetical protein